MLALHLEGRPVSRTLQLDALAQLLEGYSADERAIGVLNIEPRPLFRQARVGLSQLDVFRRDRAVFGCAARRHPTSNGHVPRARSVERRAIGAGLPSRNDLPQRHGLVVRW